MENEIITPSVTPNPAPSEKNKSHRESDTHVNLTASVFGNNISFFAKRHAVSDKELTPEPSRCLPWLCR